MDIWCALMLSEDKKNIKPEVLRVSKELSGLRLDKFIRYYIAGIKQSHLEKIIGSGGIRVNKKKVKPNCILNFNQLVSIPPGLKEQNFETYSKPKFIPLKKDIELIRSSKIYEDENIIALNKPSGLPVQGGTKVHRHIDGLMLNSFDHIQKHYLLHRLDKDTTGVLIIAKNRLYAKEFSSYLKNKNIRKTYLAIVHGKIEKIKGSIDLPLLKEKVGNNEKMIVDYNKGLKSITKYKVLEYSNGFSLVLLFPITGRTHQLRVHMSFIGHPILGDKKYNDTSKIDYEFKNSSLMLHCLQMSFPNKKLKEKFIRAEINQKFYKILKILKMENNKSLLEERFDYE